MISSFIPSWLEMICFMILWSPVLWPVIWSILENILCALERMCILLLSNGMLCFCVRSVWSKVCWFLVWMISSLLKVGYWSFLLLFYCLLLPLDVSICLTYLGAPILGAYMFMSIVLFDRLTFTSFYNSFLCLLLHFLGLQSNFFLIEIWFLLSQCIFVPSLHFAPTCILKA